MKVDTYQCDGCHVQKQGANHWFRAYRFAQGGGVVITEWEASPPLHQEDVKGESHLCGAACMNEWLSKNLLTAGVK